MAATQKRLAKALVLFAQAKEDVSELLRQAEVLQKNASGILSVLQVALKEAAGASEELDALHKDREQHLTLMRQIQESLKASPYQKRPRLLSSGHSSSPEQDDSKAERDEEELDTEVSEEEEEKTLPSPARSNGTPIKKAVTFKEEMATPVTPAATVTATPKEKNATEEEDEDEEAEERDEEDGIKAIQTREGLTTPVRHVTIEYKPNVVVDEQGFKRKQYKIGFVSSEPLKHLNVFLDKRRISKDSAFWSEARALPNNLMVSPRLVSAYVDHFKTIGRNTCSLCRQPFQENEPRAYGFRQRTPTMELCKNHHYHVVCSAYLVAMMKDPPAISYFCCLGRGNGNISECKAT